MRSSGRPVDLSASVIRNVLRLVDGLALSYLPTVVSVLVTRRNQRPGDLAADTVVIRERREIDRAWSEDAAPMCRRPSSGGLRRRRLLRLRRRWAGRRGRGRCGVGRQRRAGGGHRDRASVLERRHGIAGEARARLAAQLDGALRPRVGGADESDPERFLEILYDAKRARG